MFVVCKADISEENSPVSYRDNNYIENIKYVVSSFVVFILLLSFINYNLAENRGVNYYMWKADYYNDERSVCVEDKEKDKKYNKELHRKKCGYFQHNKSLKPFMSRPRMIQKWDMFSPGVLKRDKWLVVEATLSDGSIVDPFTGKSPVLDSVEYEILWKDINQFWRKYFTRIENKARHSKEFKKWLVHTHNDYFVDTIGNRKIKSVKLWSLTQKNASINSDKLHKVYKKQIPVKKNLRKKNNTKKDKPNILDMIKKNNQKIKKNI